MKKIVLIILCVSGSFISLAQNNNNIIPPAPIEESKFSFGFKGGFGHSFIMPYRNYEFMPSWNAGLSGVYSPFVHWGYGLDVLYSEEGIRFNNGEGSYETALHYVRVPLKAIYFFRAYEMDFRPKVSLAPTIGFLVNSDDNPAYNTIDLGASASIGFNYRLVRAIWLNVDAAYYQGLTDAVSGNSENDLNGNARLDIGLSFGF